MKPETKIATNKLKLAQNEQIIYDIISKRKLMDLVELKDLCGLSNDNGIKELNHWANKILPKWLRPILD